MAPTQTKQPRITAGGKFQTRNPEAAPRFAVTGGIRGTVIQAVKEGKNQVTAAQIAQALKLQPKVAKLHLNRATVDGFLTRTTLAGPEGSLTTYGPKVAPKAPAARKAPAKKAPAKK